MNLNQIEYKRPSGYSSSEWNMVDIWYDMGNKFICFISLDGKLVAIEKQYCDEILQSNFYESDIILDFRDKNDEVAFWCHKESKKM